MNMKKLSTAFLCLFTVMVSSCTSSEEINDLPSLSINAYIGDPQSRAEKADWEENDAIGVFVCNGTIGMWIAIPM